METHEVEFSTSWRGRNPVLCSKAVGRKGGPHDDHDHRYAKYANYT